MSKPTNHPDMSDRARLARICEYVSENGEPPEDIPLLPSEGDEWHDDQEHWISLLLRLAERGVQASNLSEERP